MRFNDKYRAAFILRMSGMTLEEVGEVIGVCKERVRGMQWAVEASLHRMAQQRERELWRMTPQQWYGKAVPVEHGLDHGGRRK